MIYTHRRIFLKGGLAGAALTLAAATGWLTPRQVHAAEWSKEAFGSKKLDEAIQALFGATATTASSAVKIKAPAQAENSAQVQIQVSTDLPNVESIAIFVEKNPSPLVARANFSGAEGFFSARMKMAQTSDVHAIVKSGGKLYSAKHTIKVTAGGCGG